MRARYHLLALHTAGYMRPALENKEAYGMSREPRSILTGKVAAPAEFEPIYEVHQGGGDDRAWLHTAAQLQSLER